eukprot:jgi/Chlat1/5307/Chrsp35S08981
MEASLVTLGVVLLLSLVASVNARGTYPTVSCPCCSSSLPANCPVSISSPQSLLQRDWIPFSAIKNPNQLYGWHWTQSEAILVIRNPRRTAAVVQNAYPQFPWQFVSIPKFPITLQPGKSLSIKVHYTASYFQADRGTPNPRVGLDFGAIRVTVKGAPTNVIGLGGVWQLQAEKAGYDGKFDYSEPTVFMITAAAGFKTVIGYKGQPLSDLGGPSNGYSGAVYSGEEVRNEYWQPADKSKPVTVMKMAEFRHGTDELAPLNYFYKSNIYWWYKLWDTTRLTDSATFCPHLPDNKPAVAQFKPTEAFTWNLAYTSGDHTLNPQDFRCTTPGNCGHNIRCWPLRNYRGALISNAYECMMDYLVGNYDFNDHMFLVTNVKPA